MYNCKCYNTHHLIPTGNSLFGNTFMLLSITHLTINFLTSQLSSLWPVKYQQDRIYIPFTIYSHSPDWSQNASKLLSAHCLSLAYHLMALFRITNQVFTRSIIRDKCNIKSTIRLTKVKMICQNVLPSLFNLTT